MRVAMYEILYMPDIPNGASINEAVEIAKKYETPETVKFINGILGSFVRQEILTGGISGSHCESRDGERWTAAVRAPCVSSAFDSGLQRSKGARMEQHIYRRHRGEPAGEGPAGQ